MIIGKKSNRMIYHETGCPYVKKMKGKYDRYSSADAASAHGYRACMYCGGIHGIYLKLQRYPNMYEKAKESMAFSFDRVDHGLCIRTDVGFWKVLENKSTGEYRLWHLNHGAFDPDIPDKQLMRRAFHRQADVKATKNVGRIIYYIANHDKAKRIMDDDWKKLPNKTPKQKKYYKQAAKREQRKQAKRLDELFKKLEKGEL